MNQSRKITDGALLTAVYVVLLLLVIFIPFFISFGVFILSIPFIIYAAKYNWKPSLIMFSVAILLSFVFATIVSLPLTLLAGIGGIAIGSTMSMNLSAYEVWARGTLGFIVGFVLVVLILQFVLNINIYAEMDIIIEESINMMKTIIDQFDFGAEVENQIVMFEEQMYTFKDLLPSSIALVSILFAFLSQWISYKIINKMENRNLSFPPFKNFNLPVAVLWIYFFALILSFIDLNHDDGLYLVILNIIALTIVLIAIQGFSFVFFYADLKNLHKAIPIMVVVLTLLLPFLFLFIIRIIGIIDLGFSLKSRLANEDS